MKRVKKRRKLTSFKYTKCGIRFPFISLVIRYSFVFFFFSMLNAIFKLANDIFLAHSVSAFLFFNIFLILKNGFSRFSSFFSFLQKNIYIKLKRQFQRFKLDWKRANTKKNRRRKSRNRFRVVHLLLSLPI